METNTTGKERQNEARTGAESPGIVPDNGECASMRRIRLYDDAVVETIWVNRALIDDRVKWSLSVHERIYWFCQLISEAADTGKAARLKDVMPHWGTANG